MTTRRMLIEDFEVMMHARQAYLAWVAACERDGEAPAPVELERRRVLSEDSRLDGALFTEWELNEEFDTAMCQALTWCHDRVEDDLALQGIPKPHLPLYIAQRKEAIRRVIARLRGEF